MIKLSKRALLCDGVAFVGLCVLGRGVWMVEPAAAYIAIGVILTGLGIYGATR